MIRAKRTSASFAWDILRADMKLILYPILRIVAMVALLAAMWHLIFDISAMEAARSMDDLANSAINEGVNEEKYGDQFQNSSQGMENTKRAEGDVSNLFGHMHFGWFFLFILINIFIGVFSVGALTAQALAVARGERKSIGYGYGMALIRSPQLIMWWLVTLIVGIILRAIESHRVLGLILAALIGMVWSVLTFFSITTIMATGCGPWGAIKRSKNTIVDSVKKVTGSESTDFRRIRRGLYIGGPLFIINFVLILLLLGLGYLDFRSLTSGGHGISLGAFAGILLVLYINGAFMSAMWAIVKATVYVWAEEDVVQPQVDTATLEKAFVAA
ncbi:MAG: DUF6159 family protein [Phycisphaerales bacterium]|nr:DUF6159 family protein [Phycisphaerales bacterium]